MYPLSFLIFIILVFSHFFLVRLCKGLSILLIFFKEPTFGFIDFWNIFLYHLFPFWSFLCVLLSACFEFRMLFFLQFHFYCGNFIFFQFYWGTTDIQHWMSSLRYSAKMTTYIHCEMITKISLVNFHLM